MSPLDPDLARALSKMMRADLDVWSDWWFWALVGSTIAVAVGIICEAPEVWQAVGLGRRAVARIRKFWYVRVRKVDFNGWERICPELITANARHRKWIARVGFVGWTLVALGVAGEGVAEYFVNDAETELRAFDQGVLTETQQSANSAALAASLATTFSDKAVTASSNGLALASGARKEADSFAQDIKAAKKQTTDAELRLADALQQVASATAEITRLKSPRSIINEDAFIVAMKAFEGTEYTFSAVFADEDSTDLLKQINRSLVAAGWKRIKSPGGFPSLDIYGKDQPDFVVPVSVISGILVSIDSSEPLEILRSRPTVLLPQHVKAAIALRNAFASDISPPEANPKLIGTEMGTSVTVQINVGKKP